MEGRASQVLQGFAGFTESLVLLQVNEYTLDVSEQESDVIRFIFLKNFLLLLAHINNIITSVTIFLTVWFR